MRIYLSGDENAARRHLPVAQAKVQEFAQETQKAGLKQNRFTFLFKETGTIVHAQYVFGQVSMQIHAPSIPMVEEVVEEIEESVVGPKTFWVNTTQGYFWVEVRYTDGVPSVILTAFEAIVGGEWVYPGFALTAPGMIAGCFNDKQESRYVLAQNGGVMAGAEEEKGTIKSTAITDNTSRITVVANTGEAHDFVLMQNTGGQSAEVRRVGVSYVEGEFVIDRKYVSIDMAYEGETNLYVTNMLPNPTWIHRKCSGSYFSPNKTIGYHVDIGADDGFLGNMQSVVGADLLDNTGGFEESLFNHTQDLYRFASLLEFPISISSTTAEFIVVLPTTGFNDDPLATKKCWGGYGLFQDRASCADYMQDFSSWLLAPRLIVMQLDFNTGEKAFYDPSLGSNIITGTVKSWDEKFSANFVYEPEYSCDTVYFNNESTDAGDQCAWSETCTWTCDTGDPGSSGECPKGWTPLTHWQYFSRENIRNSKRMYFLFGDQVPLPDVPSDMRGAYLLFDGLWHLDIGVLWTTSRIEGNYCGLCSYPYGSQEPGKNVIFAVQGASVDAILETGYEYVENMEILAPLGWVTWPLGGTVLGFIAKVPDEYAAPHEPVMVVGGVRYLSPDVDGEEVYCERALMTEPCTCVSNELVIDEYSNFNIGQTSFIQVNNGCPPFEWFTVGAKVEGLSRLLTDRRRLQVVATDPCNASVSITDACGTTVSLSDEYTIAGVVAGELFLEAGDTAVYTHNLVDAVYTGTLTMVEAYSNGALLQMPSGATKGETYFASWSGKCDSEASLGVTTVPDCYLSYDHVCVWGQLMPGPAPAYTGATVLVINNMGTNVDVRQTITIVDTIPSAMSEGMCSLGAGYWTFIWIEGYAGVGHTMIECTSVDTAYWHAGISSPPSC